MQEEDDIPRRSGSATGGPMDVLSGPTGFWVLDNFKCKFYYFSGMMRPTDQETTGIEKIVCYS